MQFTYLRLTSPALQWIGITGLLFFLFLIPVYAQDAGVCSTRKSGTIACMIRNVGDTAVHSLDPNIRVDPNVSTGTELYVTPLTTSLPLPPPQSGFIYDFNSEKGVYRQTAQSFGPIFAERAETIGRNRVFIGSAFQRVVFTTLDGVDIHNIRTAFPVPGGRIENVFNIGMELNQYTSFVGYGLTNWIDLTVAIPISTASFRVAYTAVITPAGAPVGATVFAAGRRSATGLGDIAVHVKGNFLRYEHFGLAGGATITAPTGDEYNALGAGAASIEPFLIASGRLGRITPHLNIGYRVFGKSILEGNAVTALKLRIPSQIPYAAGFDVAVARRLTAVFDVVGLEAIHADRFDAAAARTRKTYNITNGSVGFKTNAIGKLILEANLAFKLNDSGVRSKVMPLLGLSYAF